MPPLNPRPVTPARIFVVEDEPIVVRYLELQIQQLGYEFVGSASEGEAAIRLAGELRPDLLLMDVQLAGAMDGITAAQAIRDQFGLPVIFLTAFAEDSTLTRAKLADPFGYILKPFTEQDLRIGIDMALYKHQSDTRLRISEQRFRAIVEAEPECVKVVTADGELLEMNAAGLAMLEADSVDEVRSHGLLEFIRPDYRDAFGALHQSVIGGNTGMLEFEVIGLRGTRRWLETRAAPLPNADGSVTMMLGITRDITERKHAEEALRGSEAHIRSILDSSLDAIIVMDHQGGIVDFNSAAEKMFGRKCEEVLGKALADVIIPPALREAHHRGLKHYLNTGESSLMDKQVEVVALHASGREFPVEVAITRIKKEGSPLFTGFIRDISERKRAEDMIRQHNAELETRVEQRTAELSKANQELRDLMVTRRNLEKEILGISEREQRRIGQDLHDDLGQQLAGIWCLSQLLESSLVAQNSPEASSATKIAGRLKESLELTRALAQGLYPVALQADGLPSALDELALRTTEMFRVNCNCKCPQQLDIDHTMAAHLYRIAQEAVTNAIKHGQAQNIKIELSASPQYTILTVENDGAPMPKNLTKSKGMGLRIMRYRADMIAGELSIKSNKQGGGTLVACTIPTAKDKDVNSLRFLPK